MMKTGSSKIQSGLVLVWGGSLAMVVILLGLLAPLNLQNIFTDWRITSAAPALPDAIPYAVLAIAILVLRYLALAVFLAVSGLIAWLRPANWAGWLAAFTFLFLPLTFNLGGFSETWRGSFLPGLYTVFGFAGILGLLLLVYVYPDGSARPRFLRVIGGGLVLLSIGLLLVQFFGLVTEEIWWLGGVLLILITLALGIGGQIYRYRVAQKSERRQLLGFILALALLISTLLINILGSGDVNPGMALVSLFVELCLLSAIPLGLGIAILRYDLWGGGRLERRRVRLYFAGWAGLLLVGASMLVLGGDSFKAGSTGPLGDLEWNKPPVPVIVDTDLSLDDYLALLYLYQHPGVELRAVTVSGTGEAHCEPGVQHVLEILDYLGAPEIPVACGSETPIAGAQEFPKEWRQAADDLYGVALPAATRQAYPHGAVQLIEEIFAPGKEKIYLLTLGPLTNPAQALQANPELAQRIGRVIIMGGAVDTPGNVGSSGAGIDNASAEWNVFVDPKAANLVLESGAPVLLVPLDATQHLPVTMDFYQRLRSNHDTPAAQLAFDLLSSRLDYVSSGFASFWDVLAASLLVDGSLVSYKGGGILVEETEGAESGRTRMVSGAPALIYAAWADRERFEEQFLQTLNR